MPNVANPLLQAHDLPPFALVQAEHFAPALDQLLLESRHNVTRIVATQTPNPTWDDLVLAMDEIHTRLEGFGYVLHHMTSTRTGDAWERASLDCGPRLRDYQHELQHNAELARLYQRLASSEIARQFDPARKRVLEKILRRFRKNGLLPSKTDLDALQLRIENAEGLFLEQLHLANQAWTLAFDDETQLNGLPAAFKQRMANQARKAGRTGWLLTLDEESFRIVTRYADHRPLRQQIHEAYNTRASDQGPLAGQFDNGLVLTQLLDDRHHYANLLGYSDFAQLAVASEQAESTEQVLTFLYEQLQSQQSTLARDAEQLKAFATEQGIGEPEPWDYPYFAEKLSQQAAGISQQALSAWFPLDRVFSGLLAIATNLFGVNFVERQDVPTWHPDVRLYEVIEGNASIGYIYFDPFEAENGEGFPYTTTLRNRQITAEGQLQRPVAALHGWLPQGTDSTPPLLDHRQLRILFHELGHCLHHVLSQAAYRDISGIVGASRDTAEFAGCLFEQWCYQKDCLVRVSAHHRTGAPLPDAMADQLITLVTTQASWETATWLRNALLDFELHRTHADGRSVRQVFQHVSEKARHLPEIANARLANGLDHMATGYGARMYAYPWSNALAETVFARFKRDGLFNPTTGRALRENILGPGDSRPLSASIAAFLDATDQRGGTTP